MKLRSILFGLSIMAISANAGFFDHDKAYYDKHPEEAQSKFKLCDKAVAVALGKGDMTLAEKYDKDPECKAAKKSYFEHRRAAQKAKYAAEQKKRAEEKAKADAQYEIDYKEQLELQKKMPYAEFYKIKDSCGLAIGRVSAKCKVYQELRLKRKDQAMADLISQHQGDDLIAYREKTCKEKGFQSADCDLAMGATAKDEQDTIKRLSADKEALKKVFNECSAKVAAYQKKMKWNEANALTQSFKCRTAMAAARNFGVFGLSQPMK